MITYQRGVCRPGRGCSGRRDAPSMGTERWTKTRRKRRANAYKLRGRARLISRPSSQMNFDGKSSSDDFKFPFRSLSVFPSRRNDGKLDYAIDRRVLMLRTHLSLRLVNNIQYNLFRTAYREIAMSAPLAFFFFSKHNAHSYRVTLLSFLSSSRRCRFSSFEAKF